MISLPQKQRLTKQVPDFSLEIRQAIQQSIFPKNESVQYWLTELIGKPYAGQKPLVKKTARGLLAQKLTFLVGGVVLSSVAANCGAVGVIGLLVGCITNLHALRWLRLTCLHAAAHNAVFPNRQLNFILGELISFLTLTGDFRTYRQAHLKTHHLVDPSQAIPSLMKRGDETYNYLIGEADFKLGQSVQESWSHLWQTLISPKFHFKCFAKRVCQTFLSPYRDHNLVAIAFWAGLAAVVAANHTWIPFLVAVGLPISVGFEASSLLRQCVEHRFPVPATEERSRQILSQMTSAIFLAERPPILPVDALLSEKFTAWGRWGIRMLGYHLPSRLLVLTGDSPCHDWHHRVPGGDWVQAIYERERDLEASCSGWGPYLETYGLLEAIDETFKSLSLQPRDDGKFWSSKL